MTINRNKFYKEVSFIENIEKNANKNLINWVILFYFETGKYLSDIVNIDMWKDEDIKSLSDEINSSFSNRDDFVFDNIVNIVSFYKTYKKDEYLFNLTKKISWSINILIINNSKTREERELFLNMCIAHNYNEDAFKSLIDYINSDDGINDESSK